MLDLSKLSGTRQADLDSKCQVEKQALWLGPGGPTPVDFTVNRASPLVTGRQWAPLPPFQHLRVLAARRVSEKGPVILAPFSLPLFFLNRTHQQSWLHCWAGTEGQTLPFLKRPPPPCRSKRNSCISGVYRSQWTHPDKGD